MTTRILNLHAATRPSLGVAGGRTITCDPATGFLDAEDGDALLATANGWVSLGGVGTSAQRPVAQPVNYGKRFLDSTVGEVVLDGQGVWRSTLTMLPA